MAHKDGRRFYAPLQWLCELIDCNQRFGNAITSTGTLNLRHASFANDFDTIDADCDCICCKPEDQGGLGITRAYIYHVASKETAGAHL